MSKIDKYITKTKTEGVDVLEKLEIENLLQDTLEYLDDDEMSEMAIQAAGWGKKSVEKFGKTIGKSPSEEGFFDACVARMSPKKGWGKDKANGFCARLIDTHKGTTKWRGKKVHEGTDIKTELETIMKQWFTDLEIDALVPTIKKLNSKKLNGLMEKARKAKTRKAIWRAFDFYNLVK